VGTDRAGARRRIALAPMADVTIATPAVSSAQRAKGKWWDPAANAVRHHHHRPPSQWQRPRERRWLGPLSDRDIQAWQGHSPPCDGVAELLACASPQCIPDARADRRRPLTWIPDIALREVHIASVAVCPGQGRSRSCRPTTYSPQLPHDGKLVPSTLFRSLPKLAYQHRSR